MAGPAADGCDNPRPGANRKADQIRAQFLR
jgi:hypothetical protein